MYFKLHLWLHINKTFVKIDFKHKHRFAGQNNASFCRTFVATFRAKTRRMCLVFEIGYKGTKFITFTTEENLFKGIKF